MSVILTSDHAKYPPGDLAIWIFILAELLVFAILFAAYAMARMNNIELFNEFQLQLDRRAALANTVALITSSYFVVRAVTAITNNDARWTFHWLLAAMLMGGIFIGIKSSELAHHFSAGITLSTNLFYMFYLTLTTFHFMHVVLGLVILGTVAYKTRHGHYCAGHHTGVETAGAYWHMVDLVWLILFPLVYVMR